MHARFLSDTTHGVVKALYRSQTQPDDPISCYGRPVERTNEIAYPLICLSVLGQCLIADRSLENLSVLGRCLVVGRSFDNLSVLVPGRGSGP